MKAGETTGDPDGPGPDDSGTGTGPAAAMGAGVGGPPVDPRMFDGTVAAVSVLAGPEGRLIYTNSAFTRLFGVRRLGVPAREAFPDSDGHRFLAVLESVRDTGRARQVVGERRPDPGQPGQSRHFVYSCSAVTTDHGPGILVLAMDTTAETLALQRYEDLVSAVSQMVWVMGPDGGMEEIVPGWERLTGTPWRRRADAGWYAHIHPRDRERLSEAWRRAAGGGDGGRPAVFEATFRVRAEDGSYRHMTTRSVPVLRDGRLTEWVAATADVEDAWGTRLRERLLAQVAAVSGASLHEAFAEVVKVVVPELTDACLVLLLSHDEWPLPEHAGVTARRIASATRPGLPAPPALRGQGVAVTPAVRKVLDHREPVTFRLVPGAPVPPGLIPTVSERWLHASGATSLTLIPLIVEDRVLGYAATSSNGDTPIPGPAETELLREVLHHAQRPIRKVLDLQQARRTALSLQRAHLTEPPRVRGGTLAARYQPASSSGEIGGDWYDAFRLPDDTLVLDIGDVAGHDLTAATAMGQMRSMLRALAYAGGPGARPDAVLARLDHVSAGLGTAPLATALHAVLRRRADGTWLLCWSSAGHPPPLVVPAAGDAAYLPGAADPPLCVASDFLRTTHVHVLGPGDTLLLYTDGLIETPSAPIDEGQRRLASEATRCRRQSLPDLLRILQGLSDHRDDTAMLAFRVGGAP
ncbi:SpoIIE family protein phosphatase [Streptomyces sp. R302]|uniref:SpoIIE family protein phosphatase n=1 Tax=unclassified Streptomyces TaxID=2593676 RepID=UPI00145C67D1|nr:SpoIIE family protein phosphatase [Streptomyces sp. R301]NML80395.1 SpoIIE family protein phosphatase [Streptomyces sp. R302]